MKLKLNNLNSAIDAALLKTTQAVAQAATKLIEDERWDWPNETVRSTGEVAGTTRNIIDTGKLRDSQQVSIDDNTATIRYTADHAAIVHADRPFLSTTLKETDIQQIFVDKLKRELR